MVWGLRKNVARGPLVPHDARMADRASNLLDASESVAIVPMDSRGGFSFPIKDVLAHTHHVLTMAYTYMHVYIYIFIEIYVFFRFDYDYKYR